MTITTGSPHAGLVRANDLDIYVEQVGQGPDVLLIGGLGDTVESWQFQLDGLADRYRLTAFDNRGAGRTAMPEGPLTVEAMADDAAGVLRALDIPSAHVAGFSGGSIIAQELALRHPELVRSLVLQSTFAGAGRHTFASWACSSAGWSRSPPASAPSSRRFFLTIYTRRAHNDGTVDQIIEEVLAFPHKQVERGSAALHRRVRRSRRERPPAADRRPDARAGRRPRPAACRPPLCRAVAELIPGARFEVMEEESHQPFQEVPDEWNARVDAFWGEVDG